MQPPPSPAAPSGPPFLAVLGAGCAVVGVVAALCLVFQRSVPLPVVGASPLAAVDTGWRWLFGWGALPIALGLGWGGAGLWMRRCDDPWRLPWARALAIELAGAAALALLAAARGPWSPESSGPGGLVGWALATATRDLIGPAPATLAWFAIGAVAILAAFQVDARPVVDRLHAIADSYAKAREPWERLAEEGLVETGRARETGTDRPEGRDWVDLEFDR